MGQRFYVNVFTRMRFRRDASIARAKADAQSIKGDLTEAEKRAVMAQRQAEATRLTGLQANMELLNMLNLTRYTVQSLADGEITLTDIIGLAMSYILLMYQIHRLQDIAITKAGILAAMGGPTTAAIAVIAAGGAIGLAAGAEKREPKRTATVDRRALTRSARRLGVVG